MPEQPFAITGLTPEEKVEQALRMMQELFEERIGGANIGDVFTVGGDDVLTLSLSSTGGLEKSSSAVKVKAASTGGIKTDSNGTAVKIKASSGLTSDADGLQNKKQAHIVDAEDTHAITDPADSPASADALRDDLVANTIPEIKAALDALGAKLNALLLALETGEILAGS